MRYVTDSGALQALRQTEFRLWEHSLKVKSSGMNCSQIPAGWEVVTPINK